uniref:Poly-gamma-glutamate synthesis protein (Capsule biosynthesis protein) n=1 Tax=Candidatus Kentrum sp. FW TaxID=2126338 RepID=A0A450RTF6_9GAMM|nr:MAG: poly-gamma-glutamate synthesis protein (capsule biosynthesis protein) [Candidatus Kentron sp. FW]
MSILKIAKDILLAGAFWFCVVSGLHAEQDMRSPFVAAAWDKAALTAAIEAERPAFDPPKGVTGLTVPHHLLAADLVARGFWAASGNEYERIILISPDHFRKVQGHFSVARADLETVFGSIPTDGAVVDTLLAQPALFEPATDIQSEHGILSVAPFIRHFFPDTPTITIVASIDAMRDAWEQGVAALEPFVTDNTLIIQSTDYSHYLLLPDAIRRDQETLATIAAMDGANISRMLQPAHMDSRAAQYLQLVLQKNRFGAMPVIIANRNSAEYGSGIGSTTSYVVSVFLRDPAAGSVLRYEDHQLTFLAGDTLLGRYFQPILQNRQTTESIADTVLGVTRGAPLVINLEGVLLDEPVVGLGSGSHAMLTETAMPLLKRLNVIAAGLANNHSHDLGALGFAESVRILSEHGLMPLKHGEIGDLGGFRILPLGFHRGRGMGQRVVGSAEDLKAVCAQAAEPPLVAFVHWGTEYTDTATDAEREAALALNRCGVTLVAGAHSHQATRNIESLAGGAVQLVFSLGNFAFDQRSDRASGALLELRVFKQGTIAARLVPIPNLFEVGGEQRNQKALVPKPARLPQLI